MLRNLQIILGCHLKVSSFVGNPEVSESDPNLKLFGGEKYRICVKQKKRKFSI